MTISNIIPNTNLEYLSDMNTIRRSINNTIIPNYYSLYNRSLRLLDNLNKVSEYIDFVNNTLTNGDSNIVDKFNTDPHFCNWNKKIIFENTRNFYSDCSITEDLNGQTMAELHTSIVEEIQSELIEKRDLFDVIFREQFTRLYDLDPNPNPTYPTCVARDTTSTDDIQDCSAVGCLNDSSECESIMRREDSNVVACIYSAGTGNAGTGNAGTPEPSGTGNAGTGNAGTGNAGTGAIVYTNPLINCKSNNNCPTICESLDDIIITNLYNNFINFNNSLVDSEERYKDIRDYYTIAYNLVREVIMPEEIEEDKTQEKRNLIIIILCSILLLIISPIILISAALLLK